MRVGKEWRAWEGLEAERRKMLEDVKDGSKDKGAWKQGDSECMELSRENSVT